MDLKETTSLHKANSSFFHGPFLLGPLAHYFASLVSPPDVSVLKTPLKSSNSSDVQINPVVFP